MDNPSERTNGRSVKEQARHLVDQLDPNATWDDLMYQIYVHQAVESGMQDVEAGRTVDVSDGLNAIKQAGEME